MRQINRLTRASIVIALMAVSAHLKIPIGAVPMTLQTTVCIVGGLILGARWGGLAMVAYMALGLFGLPVFSGGGGPGYVLSPTFGYIIGFIAAAMVAGKMGERISSVKSGILIVATALFFIYTFGVTYLFLILRVVQEYPIDLYQALSMGAIPFVAKDFVTGMLGVLLYFKLKRNDILPGK